MTIDERLEALAQHAKILSEMQIKTEENLQRLEKLVINIVRMGARLQNTVKNHGERIEDLEARS